MFANTITKKTVFSKNVSSGNGFVVSAGIADRSTINMYTRLSNVVQSINLLMTEYSAGNFYAVSNILTQEAYNRYSISLATLAQNPSQYPEYENIRASSTSALAGLYQSIIQYTNYVNLEAQLQICKQHEAILYDPVLLSDFINKMQQNRQIFPESKVTAKMATLKPEYAAYIEQYGFPEGCVFDPDRLAYILENM